jgi:hypothetical protein
MKKLRILNLGIVGLECSVLQYGRFTPGNNWKGGWVDTRMISTL